MLVAVLLTLLPFYGYVCNDQAKKDTESWLLPIGYMPKHNISRTVSRLNLQQCAIVEVGEFMCAIFVEIADHPDFPASFPGRKTELFMGICGCLELHKWTFCGLELQVIRSEDCKFHEGTSNASTSARVHRRLCDITAMADWNSHKQCNCMGNFGNRPLLPVSGFPMCFQHPLPYSLCIPRSVCGIAQCEGKEVINMYSVSCDPNCKGHQPFCEKLGPETTAQRSELSIWSEWSHPTCNASCGSGYVVSQSICVNKLTEQSAFDCIGPGFFCCPIGSSKCKCHLVKGSLGLMVTRTFGTCYSSAQCDSVPKMSMNLLLQNLKNRFLFS